jgi:hypothetical protein
MNKNDFKDDLLDTVIKLIAEDNERDFPFGPSVNRIEGLSLNCVYDESAGDGNECVRVTEICVDDAFIGHIRTIGTYSSWGNNTWYPEETTLVNLVSTIVNVWVNADGSEHHKHKMNF